MSFFVFGVADLPVESDNGQARARARARMEACGAAAGVSVRVESDDEPEILAEMRGKLVARTSMPFLCVKQPSDDTSDALVSPYALGVEGAVDGCAAVARWARCVLADGTCAALRIWFSEGWDDAFEICECTPDELDALLRDRVREANDVPSMRILVTSSP